MFRNLCIGYRKKAVTVLFCMLLLTVAVLLAAVAVSLSIQIGEAEVLPATEEYIGVIVPTFSSVKGGQVSTFQNGGYEQFSIVNGVEVRKLAAAYSEGLAPIHLLQRHEENLPSAAPDMPTDFFIGTIVCDEILYEEFEPGREDEITGKTVHTYRYGYRCHLQEVVNAFSEDAVLDLVTVEITLYHEGLPAPPMRIGGTYLVWGILDAYEDGSAVLTLNQHRGKAHALFVTEENGFHWLMESAFGSGFVVPFLSEIRGPLSEFWKTEAGAQWSEVILPKGEVQQHSVMLVGTTRMDSILSFNRGTAYIVEGTTPEEAADKRGCLISEELAKKNGLTLGDALPLSVYQNHSNIMYDSTYLPYTGFTEKNTWQIVGIYRTEDDLYDVQAVHPNTVYVSSESLAYDYAPFPGVNGANADSSAFVDARYALLIPVDAEAAFYAESTVLGFPQKYFAFGDSGYAEETAVYSELDAAMEQVKEDNRTILIMVLSVSSVLAVIAFALLVRSAKGEIERVYTVDTSESRLFRYLFLRQGGVLLCSCCLAALLISPLRAPMSQGWLSFSADISTAEELLRFLPSPHTWVIYEILAVSVVVMAGLAWLGAKRKYHFVYHDREVKAC